jgi:ATP-dependent Clp protease ATP-binding subunit ClpA
MPTDLTSRTLPGTFVGRDHELWWLRRTLIDEQPRVIWLVGPPGVGKTSLMMTFSQQSINSAAVVYIPARDLSDLAVVPNLIARLRARHRTSHPRAR